MQRQSQAELRRGGTGLPPQRRRLGRVPVWANLVVDWQGMVCRLLQLNTREQADASANSKYTYQWDFPEGQGQRREEWARCHQQQ